MSNQLVKTKSVDASTSTSADMNHLKPPKPSHTKTSIIITAADVENKPGVANKAYEKSSEDESDSSDVSTTYIDGKRAVSISNFEKFTAQQIKEGKEFGTAFGGRKAPVNVR
jgi:hypothetical protein